MARKPESVERVSSDELSEGDTVIVHVNSRASRHLGERSFEATVDSTGFGDVRFKPTEQLQEEQTTHTWYPDIGYIHGHHDGLDGYSDIGKVRYVER